MVPPPNAPRQDPPMEPEGTKISLFKGREVRKILHQGEWWFVVNDIIETLTDSRDPSQYFKRLKGYSPDWIEKRMRGIAIREEPTDEWKGRGAREDKDYELLTAEISKATLGVTPSEYKKLKGLKRENLRDHMDDFVFL